MKKFLSVMAFVLIFVGCEPEAGTWKVININCPSILAEKSGKKRIFVYDEPINAPDEFIYKQCLNKVRLGWIIEVDIQRVAFFPPTDPIIPSCEAEKKTP